LHSKRIKQSKLKVQKNFSFRLSENNFVTVKISSCPRENFLTWTKIVQRVLLIQGYFHLGKNTSSPRWMISRLGENSLESILAPGRDYLFAWAKLNPRAPLRIPSELAWTRLPRLGEKCRKNQQYPLPQSYHTCLKWRNSAKFNPHTQWMIYPDT